MANMRHNIMSLSYVQFENEIGPYLHSARILYKQLVA